MKKSSVVLTVVLLVALLVSGMCISASAEETVRVGKWGDLGWILNEITGELVILGTGEMDDFSLDSNDAWQVYKASIKSVTIGSGITSIGESAFCYCSHLTSVEIPDSVTSIGVHAFYNCSALTSIELPDSVTRIENFSFAYSENLASIKLSERLESIGEGAFYECRALTNLVIPDGVTSIGAHAFYYCCSLTSIELPDSLTSIDRNMFWYCRGLTSILIPNSVTSIGDHVLFSCEKLEKIVYCGTQSQWEALSRGLGWDSNAGDFTVFFHAYGEGVVTTEPTHLTEGVLTSTCVYCGEAKTEAVEKLAEHSCAYYVNQNLTTHKGVCACGAEGVGSHHWNDGEVAQEPSQEREGTKIYTCPDCGATKTESIARLSPQRGCDLVISGGVAILLVVGSAACFVGRKKED